MINERQQLVRRLSKAAVLTVAAGAAAPAAGSPGVAGGNVIQVPIHAPVNICGNSLNFIALANPAIGNPCVNG